MAAEEEHEGRRQGPRAKFLPIAAAAGTIRGTAPATADPDAEDERSVAGEAARGFAGGVLAAAQMNLEERASAPRSPERDGTAAVRKADGRTRADRPVRKPGEDPLPGSAQPLVVDALDAVEGISSKRSRGSAGAVVMHPDHVAGLKALEDRHDEGFENDGGRFGR